MKFCIGVTRMGKYRKTVVLEWFQAKPKQPGGGGCKSRRARRITLFAPTAHSLSQYPLCVECEYECVLVVIWLFVVLYTVLWSVSCGSISVSGTMEEDSVSGGHSQKEWRERFMTTVLQSENEKSTHFNVLTKDKYQQLINEVETAANTDKKTPLQQRRLKRFGVIDIGGVKNWWQPVRETKTSNELYDVIDAAHGAVGHGGRDRMLAETSKKYANIMKEEIQLYLSMCQCNGSTFTRRVRDPRSSPGGASQGIY
ncbi:hypothetical protein J6590_083896 [Homalodisca vitripennis]|nr:hypothetical protein J6590_083896 [Homalodisca vitripennis]